MQNEPLETINYKNNVIKIMPDYDGESPREWDNLGTMFYAHGRYELGDVNLEKENEEFNNWNDIQKYLIKKYNPEVILPLFLYDHSTQHIKVGSFNNAGLPQGHAYFDSGQVGYILAEKEKVRKEYNIKRITKKLHERAEKVLQSEVKTFNDYLEGNIVGYIAETKTGQDIGSCWGYYGEDGYAYAISEAKSDIDYKIEKQRKVKQSKLKTLIKNNVNLQTRQEILI